MSLHLDYVYGYLAYDKRRTLYYVHMYSTSLKKKKGFSIQNTQKDQPPQKKTFSNEQRKKMESL